MPSPGTICGGSEGTGVEETETRVSGGMSEPYHELLKSKDRGVGMCTLLALAFSTS